TVPDDIRWSLHRTKLELFYREAITAELLALDNRGRYRAAVMLFELVELTVRVTPDGAAEPLGHSLKFVRTRGDTASAIAYLLRLTPLMRGDGAWDCDTVFDGDQLSEFIRFCTENKAPLENVLQMEIRADLKAKPVSQLSAVLRLIGLTLQKVGTTKRGAKKIYRYRLDRDSLQRLKALQHRRETTTAWRRIPQLHGWRHSEDEDFDDAA